MIAWNISIPVLNIINDEWTIIDKINTFEHITLNINPTENNIANELIENGNIKNISDHNININDNEIIITNSNDDQPIFVLNKK